MGKCGENEYNNKIKESQNPTKVQRKPIKVKYISSPMMIKASNALEFRAIVQQLTGFNSDDDDIPFRRRHEKSHVDDDGEGEGGPIPPPSMLLENHKNNEVVSKFSDHDMSSLLQFDDDCFARHNLSNSFMGFQSPCLFQ